MTYRRKGLRQRRQVAALHRSPQRCALHFSPYMVLKTDLTRGFWRRFPRRAFAVALANAAGLFVLAAVGAVVRFNGGEHTFIGFAQAGFVGVDLILQFVERRDHLIVTVEL